MSSVGNGSGVGNGNGGGVSNGNGSGVSVSGISIYGSISKTGVGSRGNSVSSSGNSVSGGGNSVSVS